MIIVGSVIGSGIFISTGPVVQHLPSPLWALLIWFFGGFITLLGCLIYAEFGSRWPEVGGDYIYLKNIYNPLAGFMVGWAGFWLINPASIAALSLAVSEYLYPFVSTEVLKKLIAIGIILVFSTIHFVGMKIGSLVQNTLTVLKIFAIIGIALAVFFSGKGSFDYLNTPTGGSFTLSATGVAMIYVIFTYSGWFTSAYVAGEIKNPRKNLPRSLFWGVSIVTTLYLLINLAYVYAIEPSLYSQSDQVATLAFSTVLGARAATFVSAVIIIAILGSISAVVLTAPRIYYAMANDGLFFNVGKHVHSRFQTPWVSIVIQGVLACLYVLWGTLEDVLMMIGFPMIVISLVTGAGLFKLRKEKAAAKDSFRTPFYPWVPLLFVLSYGAIAVAAFVGAPTKALGGLLILGMGIPIYFLFKKQGSKP